MLQFCSGFSLRVKNVSDVSEEKLVEWRQRAAAKQAIVPGFFEVFPHRVVLKCGKCGLDFNRNLVMNIDEPVFVCPDPDCRARNWVPVKYERFKG